jgi:hypothetical protein
MSEADFTRSASEFIASDKRLEIGNFKFVFWFPQARSRWT